MCRQVELSISSTATLKAWALTGFRPVATPIPRAEGAAHKLLLGAKKLLLEDISIPDALLDGKRRHFAAFPILIANAGGAWTRPVVWDDGDLDTESSAPELASKLPHSVAASMALQRSEP